MASTVILFWVLVYITLVQHEEKEMKKINEIYNQLKKMCLPDKVKNELMKCKNVSN